MKAALPDQGAAGPSSAAPSTKEEPKRPDKPAGDWGQVFTYDYTETDNNRQWGANGAVYEWTGEEGDVGPENPELEIQLFGAPEERFTAGIDISK